jgi:hypothetical protein
MVNIALNEVKGNSYEVPEPFIIDEKTGVKRPKHIVPKEKPRGVLPHFTSNRADNADDKVEISLSPEDWFLTQASIMACIPVSDTNIIPVELVDYVNSNFNTYPSSEMNYYVRDFSHSLLLKNHDPSLAYGFTVDVRPRTVNVKGFELNYIDILVAVNKHIDSDFAEKIKNQTIKFLSWGHTSGDYYCGVCGEQNGDCVHLSDMMMRNTPEPAILSGRPYGVIHRFTPEFHVYDVSYLDVRPAYDGAITHKVMELDKPLKVMVSKKELEDKAVHATCYEEGIKPDSVVSKLFKQLKI